MLWHWRDLNIKLLLYFLKAAFPVLPHLIQVDRMAPMKEFRGYQATNIPEMKTWSRSAVSNNIKDVACMVRFDPISWNQRVAAALCCIGWFPGTWTFYVPSANDGKQRPYFSQSESAIHLKVLNGGTFEFKQAAVGFRGRL